MNHDTLRRPNQPNQFRTKVYRVVRAIPAGQVLTYGEVATRAGYPGAARAVGAVMRANPKSFVTHPNDRDAVPCHRVVAANYQLGGFNQGSGWKARLLQGEGWQITNNQLIRHEQAMNVSSALDAPPAPASASHQ